MIINLVEKVSDLPLVLETEHDDPDKKVRVQFIGEKIIANNFIQTVSSGKFGYYGHTFYLSDTTNLDLQQVVQRLDDFTVLSVNPKIKAKRLPKGVAS